MIIKNIESKVRLAFTVSIGSLITCIAVVIAVLAYSFNLISNERKKIYVLDNEVPVLVKQTGIEVNLEVEAKSHVNLFHMLFFTLPPDDDFIRRNVEKAMYLVDESGLKQYNNLKEKGYYNTILSSSATVTIATDSVLVDLTNMTFEYYGIQRIERETSILKREVVTQGRLRQIPRTDNNPHGLIITDWKTIVNKDIEYKAKRNF
jgi:conjugative transposon TraK protein